MPAEGIDYLKKTELLSFEEIIKSTEILASLGIKKVRITGGEPFLRKDIIHLLEGIKNINGIESLHLTTNGILTGQYMKELVALGIDSVNLSLDTLDKENFFKITRRNEFDKVMKTLDDLLANNIKTKINMVVMKGKNEHEVAKLAELSKDRPINVRYIEEMPFNGSDAKQNDNWSHVDIKNALEEQYGKLELVDGQSYSSSTNYRIEGHQGNIGIIPAFSRTFCGSCNRIRITSLGEIKNCLYDEGVLDLKALIRNGASDHEIKEALIQTVDRKEKNGFEAELNRRKDKNITESMSTIGG